MAYHRHAYGGAGHEDRITELVSEMTVLAMG